MRFESSMPTTRRYFLLGALGGLSFYAYQRLKSSPYWPDEGQFFNPCLGSILPPHLAHHEVLLSALEGLDTRQIWDGHVHLIGLGDTPSGTWINPRSRRLSNPWRYLQYKFFFNASCPLPGVPVDEGYVSRLKELRWGTGNRLLLLAFDYAHNEKGEALPQYSAFYTPNHYAMSLHEQFFDNFEWIASIHPYRKDSIEALEHAFAHGARGVKWLPSSMGIDLASPYCKNFYETMARLEIPLLCHAGTEHSAPGMGIEEYGNPLKLRHPLEQGVKVVVAHCASAGNSPDIDRGPQGPQKSNFEFFTRLMEEQRYEGLLFGDISTIAHLNRVGIALEPLLAHPEWHARLLYGSDYPLPGVIPVISLKLLVEKQYINFEHAQVLARLRLHNPLWFDFVLNRHLQVNGHHFSPEVFLTRSFWTGARFWKVVTPRKVMGSLNNG